MLRWTIARVLQYTSLMSALPTQIYTLKESLVELQLEGSLAIHWGYSSAGRAPDLHSGGQQFDPA
jgi:hypothetical protein